MYGFEKLYDYSKIAVDTKSKSRIKACTVQYVKPDR